jgi:alkylated DNA repair dioxygenase AlkB
MESAIENPKTIIDENGALVRLWPEILDRDHRAQAYVQLLISDHWQTDVTRRGPSQRKIMAFGDKGTVYRYNGIDHPAMPWTPAMLSVRHAVEHALNFDMTQSFNFCLANLYPSGKVGLGYHSDDEVDMMPNSIVASVSLGAERSFHMRRYKSALEGGALYGETTKFPLPVGSLLTMEGRTQELWKHSVPVTAKCPTARINLTFRQMKPRVPKSESDGAARPRKRAKQTKEASA